MAFINVLANDGIATRYEKWFPDRLPDTPIGVTTGGYVMSDMPPKSGIYCIINNVNGKIYVGSSINLQRRQKTHFSKLSNGNHENDYLQNSANKYGVDKFEFHILELIGEENTLLEREQFWLDEAQCYKSNNGYNISPTAGSPLGVKHTEEAKENMRQAQLGKKLSQETKNKISVAIKGKKHTEKARYKISMSKRGKLNPMWKRSGTDHPMWGTKASPQTRSRLSKATKRHFSSQDARKNASIKRKQWWDKYYVERDSLQLLLF